MNTSTLRLKISTFLIMFLALLVTSSSSKVAANSNLNMEILSNDGDTIELVLRSVEPKEDITLEVSFSAGLEFVEVLPFDETPEIAVDFNGGQVVRISSQFGDPLLGTNHSPICIVKLSRISEENQMIELRDMSDDRTYVSTYYSIPSSSNSFAGNVLDGIDISTFLSWTAVVIFASVSILIYYIFTTYTEESSNQQYVLFGFGAILILTFVNLVIVMSNLGPEEGGEVMGLQYEYMKYGEFNDITAPGDIGSDCSINAYPFFLEDYLIYRRESVLNPSSDLSNNGVIDNVDLNMFADCIQNGE